MPVLSLGVGVCQQQGLTFREKTKNKQKEECKTVHVNSLQALIGSSDYVIKDGSHTNKELLKFLGWCLRIRSMLPKHPNSF